MRPLSLRLFAFFLISFKGDDRHRLTIAGTGHGQDPVPIVQVSKHE